MKQKVFVGILAFLFLLSFAFKLYFLDFVPLRYDGTVYAEMIAEQADELTFLPRYMGTWAPIKPGLYFIVYSFFFLLTSSIFSSIEWIYRSPNLIFGILNALLCYLIARKFSTTEVAMVTALLFYCCFCTFLIEERLLMEPLMLTTLLSTLFFYTRDEFPPVLRFGGAALFAFLAALTKSVIAFALVPLSLALVYQKNKNSLANPLFLVSLSAPFLGLLVFYLSLDHAGLTDVIFNDTGKFFVFDFVKKSHQTLTEGIVYFFVMCGIYLGFSFYKIKECWKEQIFFSIWLFLSLIPILSGEPHHWYFYYIVPAFAFFAALSLSARGRFDNFSTLALILLVVVNLGISAFGISIFNYDFYHHSKEAGLELSGKENVLVAGIYEQASIAAIYKRAQERQDYGKPLDMGYTIFSSSLLKSNSKRAYFNAVLDEIARDYNTQKYQFEEESFARFFWINYSFRKATEIREFEYIAVMGNVTVDPDKYDLQYENPEAKIYWRSEEP